MLSFHLAMDRLPFHSGRGPRDYNCTGLSAVLRDIWRQPAVRGSMDPGEFLPLLLQLLNGGINLDKLPDILIPAVNRVKNKP